MTYCFQPDEETGDLLTNAGQQYLKWYAANVDTEQQGYSNLLLESCDSARASCASLPMWLITCFTSARFFARPIETFRFRFDAGKTEPVITSLDSYDADIGGLGEIPQGRRLRRRQAEFNAYHRLCERRYTLVFGRKADVDSWRNTACSA